MDKKIKELAKVFTRMVENANNNEAWRNIPLGKQAFELMLALPDVVAGEIESEEEKAGLLANMLAQMNELDTPRFCITVREEMERLNPCDSQNAKSLRKLRDYINLDMPNEEWMQKYHRTLKFDPMERTPEWEEHIYEVEKELADRFDDTPRHMGFCFGYWSAKADILMRYGMEWRSPRQMNPRVIFD